MHKERVNMERCSCGQTAFYTIEHQPHIFRVVCLGSGEIVYETTQEKEMPLVFDETDETDTREFACRLHGEIFTAA